MHIQEKTWQTSFWLDKFMLIGAIPVSLFVLLFGVDSPVATLVFLAGGASCLATSFCDKESKTWILAKGYEKTAYVYSVFVWICFSFGFLYGVMQ